MRPHILLVEDDPDNAVVLRMLLEGGGYVVRHAGDVGEARRQVSAWKPDLAVLDLILPDGTALDFCNELRESEPPVPVILLTAWDEARLRAEAMERCADAFVSKPFDPDHLEATVRRLLERGGGTCAA